MTAKYTVNIRNFKSVSSLEFNLERVNVLVGPPSSGKSNILEALAVFGYAVKVGLETIAGVYTSPDSVPHLSSYVRGVTCDDLINRFTIAQRGRKTEIVIDDYMVVVECRHSYKATLHFYRLPEEKHSWKREWLFHFDLRYTELPSINSLVQLFQRGAKDVSKLLEATLLKDALETTKKHVVYNEREERNFSGEVIWKPSPSAWKSNAIYPSPRLYGFDRMGVLSNVSTGNTGMREPLYPEEHGLNLGSILYPSRDVVEAINDVLGEVAGNVRVEPLHDGRLAFYDGVREVGSSSVSDTVVRLLYGLTAILLSTTYTDYLVLPKSGKRIKATFAPIVMLEEPEAHMYPLAYTVFAKMLRRAVEANPDTVYVITTHSPALASSLWEALDEVNVYYVAREPGGSTRLGIVDMDRLVSTFVYPGEVVEQPLANIEEHIQWIDTPDVQP